MVGEGGGGAGVFVEEGRVGGTRVWMDTYGVSGGGADGDGAEKLALLKNICGALSAYQASSNSILNH